MSLEEKAKVIALARLCGINETGENILKKYTALYKIAFSELTQDSGPAEVAVFKRPF